MPAPKFTLKFPDGKPATMHERPLVVATIGSLTLAMVHQWPIRTFGYLYAESPGKEYALELEEAYLEVLSGRPNLILGGDFNFDFNGLAEAMPTLVQTLGLLPTHSPVLAHTMQNRPTSPDNIWYGPTFKTALTQLGSLYGNSTHRNISAVLRRVPRRSLAEIAAIRIAEQEHYARIKELIDNLPDQVSQFPTEAIHPYA